MAMANNRRLLLVGAVALASIGCDQATKRVASALLERGVVHSWLGDTFRLQYAENRGAFLSLGAFLPEAARFWVFVVAVGLLLAGMLGYALLHAELHPLEV